MENISENQSAKTSVKSRGEQSATTDKKKLKVLKTALKEERHAKEELINELQAIKNRNQELEKENDETNNKYLKLYDENDRL